MTTDELVERLQEYPKTIVRIQDPDFRLLPVENVEFVESTLGNYVWLKVKSND